MKKLWIWILAAVLLVGLGAGLGRILKPSAGIEKDYTFTINVLVTGDFTCTLTPAELTLKKGETGTVQVTNVVSGGFDAKIQYEVTGLPTGAVSFSVNPVDPGQATTMTINTAALTSNTAYVCTLTARDL
jgi:hypothetical protein